MSHFPATFIYDENTDHPEAYVEVDVDTPRQLLAAVAEMKKYNGSNPFVVNNRGEEVKLETALRWK